MNSIQSLKNNIKGIYELSSKKKYPFYKTNISYIGSSKDIKRRLSSYTVRNAHSVKIEKYLENNDFYFRIITTTNYKEYEKIFINVFISMTGVLPKLNKQRILRTCKIIFLIQFNTLNKFSIFLK